MFIGVRIDYWVFFRKLGLGPDPSAWIDKIRRGEILPGTSLQTKVCTFLEVYEAF